MFRQTFARHFLYFFVIYLTFFALGKQTHAAQNASWQMVSPGIMYQDLEGGLLTPWSHIHVFKIDLKQNQLSLVSAKDLDRRVASVDEYAEHSNALLTINGGFFDEKYQSLGLRIANYKELSPLKRISWWGVFYIKNNKPMVSTAGLFHASPAISFAVQSGPRLLVNGHIPPLKPGRAERSALGITTDNQVIMLITDNAPLSTIELAQLMKSAPLNCVQALNLDGGSSTQLNAKMNRFQLNVHGFAHVSDAIIVKPLV